MGALYQIAFPNGKRYIGMTEGEAARRFLDHRYHARIEDAVAARKAGEEKYFGGR